MAERPLVFIDKQGRRTFTQYENQLKLEKMLKFFNGRVVVATSSLNEVRKLCNQETDCNYSQELISPFQGEVNIQ